MLEIGRVCMKIAGRDAGKKGIVIDILDENYVLLDGEVRRRKCNIHHLEPMAQSVELKKNASHADVLKVLGIKEDKKKSTKKKKHMQNLKRKRKLQLKRLKLQKKLGLRRNNHGFSSRYTDAGIAARSPRITRTTPTSSTAKK